MNNVQIINRIDFYPNQRRSFLAFDNRLEQVDTNESGALDRAVRNMKDFLQHTGGAKLAVLVHVSDFIIDHRAMERQLRIGLKNFGMSGASQYDTEILAGQMLDFPVRDYDRHYFISPRFGHLANLNADGGKAVRSLWSHALSALVEQYGTKKAPQYND